MVQSVYYCSLCSKRFKIRDRGQLNKHYLEEHQRQDLVEWYACPKAADTGCTDKWVSPGEIAIHVRLVHDEHRTLAICPVEGCGKSVANLKKHTATHRPSASLICDFPQADGQICGQKCKNAVTLRGHQKTHFTDQMVFCGMGDCTHKCRRRTAMRKHQSTAAHIKAYGPPPEEADTQNPSN